MEIYKMYNPKQEMAEWIESFLMYQGINGCSVQKFVDESVEVADYLQYDYKKNLSNDLQEFVDANLVFIHDEVIKWNFV